MGDPGSQPLSAIPSAMNFHHLALGMILACCVAMFTAAVHRKKLPPGPDRSEWEGTVFGHRGCRFVPGFPENTLAAFQKAYQSGCNGIELDVRLTKDDQLIVFHDTFVGNTLKRSSNAPSDVREVSPDTRIDELLLSEVKACVFTADSSGEIRVPTLEEVILFSIKRKVRLLIEIKELRRVKLCTRMVVELFAKYPTLYDNATIISFHPQAVYLARQLDAGVSTGQLFSSDLIQSWDTKLNGPLPWFVRIAPRMWDSVLQVALGKLSPWLAGCSLLCPKYTISRRRWRRGKGKGKRRMGIYLWGFQSSKECTPEMWSEGVCVSGDNGLEDYVASSPHKRRNEKEQPGIPKVE